MSADSALAPDQSAIFPATARLDGLDWLRAGAAVLVVALHAGIGYLVARMPGLAWSTHDPVGSRLVDGLTWWINGFIMPLFFVQSGFLAAQLLQRKGPQEFLRHRSRRLLGPLILGCLLILPLDLYVWLLGWAADGKISLRKLRSLKIDSPLGDNLWGVSHLWFLEYLWVFCAVAWGVSRFIHWQSGKVAKWRGRKAASGPTDEVGRWQQIGGGNLRFEISHFRSQGSDLGSPISNLISQISHFRSQISNLGSQLANFRFRISDSRSQTTDFAPPLASQQFAIPNSQFAFSRRSGGIASVVLLTLSGFALWWEPQILIGFRHSWWPLPANLLFYGPWFFLGWLASASSRGSLIGRSSARRASAGVRWSRLPFAHLCEWRIAAAVVLFAGLLPLIHHHVLAGSNGPERALLVGMFMLHAWLMVTGLFGGSLKWLNRRRPPTIVRYVAEASFWVYLFHHPVVGLTQVSLSQLSLPIAAKFAVTLATGLILPLLTYQSFVRRSWIGVVLHGRRQGMAAKPASADLLPLPVPESAPLRKSA